jgi:hypothetical protein
MDYSKLVMPKPTLALPGSKEKKKVLAERYMRGEFLWHPMDAKLDNRKCRESKGERGGKCLEEVVELMAEVSLLLLSEDRNEIKEG